MRLNVVTDIDSRDGSMDRDERLTNALAEQFGKYPVVSVRPALKMLVDSVGNGNGIVCFNGTLVSVFGAELGYPVIGEYRYDTVTGTITDTIIDGVKFGSNYIVKSEYAIYTSSDLSTFTYYDPGGLEHYAGLVVAGDSICLSSYTDEMGDIYVLSWDTGMNLTVTPYSEGIYFPMAYGAGKFVANVSFTKTATSTNGTSWTTGSDLTLPDGVSALYGNFIKYSVGVFCRHSGEDDSWEEAFLFYNGNTYTYTSSNGLDWNGPYSAPVGILAAIEGHGFIIAGFGTCHISTNGSSWTEYQLIDAEFQPVSVAYDAVSDLICIVGKKQHVYATYTYHTIFSGDKGKTWMASADTNHYTAVVPTGGGFALFKHTANVNAITNITNLGELTNIDSLVDAPIDFALIP